MAFFFLVEIPLGLFTATVSHNVACGLELVGESSGEIGIAGRRQKVRLARAAPGGDRVRLEGRIDELAYYGNARHVSLENEARTTAPAAPKVAIGDELWMSWHAADTLVPMS